MRKFIFSIIVLVVFSAILLPVPLAGSEQPVLRVGVASMITPVSAFKRQNGYGSRDDPPDNL